MTRRITGVPISSFHSAGMPHRGFHGGVVMSRCDLARSSQCFRDTSRTSSTGGSPGFRLGCSSIFRLPLSILHPPLNESASSALLLCHRHRYFIEFVLLLPTSLLPPPPSSLLLAPPPSLLLPHPHAAPSSSLWSLPRRRVCFLLTVDICCYYRYQ